MSGFLLKLIAMITMLIDHTAAILLTDSKWYLLLRGIGRLAFPIYCFLLVEGYFHTKNVKKYMLRLGIFALLSEIPFDLAFTPYYSHLGFLQIQNVFFTLFIGLSVIHLMRMAEERYKKTPALSYLLSGLAVIIGCTATVMLRTDYRILGIPMIVSFYLFRNSKIILTLVLFLLNQQLGGGLQTYAFLAMAPIWFYNGKKGYNMNRYIFYVFYPAHILILVFLKFLLKT